MKRQSIVLLALCISMSKVCYSQILKFSDEVKKELDDYINMKIAKGLCGPYSPPSDWTSEHESYFAHLVSQLDDGDRKKDEALFFLQFVATEVSEKVILDYAHRIYTEDWIANYLSVERKESIAKNPPSYMSINESMMSSYIINNKILLAILDRIGTDACIDVFAERSYEKPWRDGLKRVIILNDAEKSEIIRQLTIEAAHNLFIAGTERAKYYIIDIKNDPEISKNVKEHIRKCENREFRDITLTSRKNRHKVKDSIAATPTPTPPAQ